GSAPAAPQDVAPDGMPAETPAISDDAAAMPGVAPTVFPETQPVAPPVGLTPTEHVPLPRATEPAQMEPVVPAPAPAPAPEPAPVLPTAPPTVPHDAGGEVRAPVTPPEIPALPEPVAPPVYPATPEVTVPATESTAPPLLTPTAPADGTDGGLVPYKSVRRTAPETLDGPIVPVPPASTALPGGADVPADGTTTYKAPLRRAPETLDAPITVPPLPTPPATPAEPVTTESGTGAP
ncbi:hypothetical protein FVW27_15065, partial [Desulfovibrio sp. XJ01]|nr:hypothetical protein [Nitratidesulfovibrio liaohensis]